LPSDKRAKLLAELVAVLETLLALFERAPKELAPERQADPILASPTFLADWESFPVAPFRAQLDVLRRAADDSTGVDRSSVRGALTFFNQFPRPYDDIAPTWSSLFSAIDNGVTQMHRLTRELY